MKLPIRFRREGKGLAAPSSGIRRYFYLLWTHAWKLVCANILFVVFSLPVVTVPAAISSLNRVCIKLVREGNCLLWEEFRDEFRSSFVRSLPLGLRYAIGYFAAYYLLSISSSNGAGFFATLFMALGLLVYVLTALGGTWSFLLLSMLDLPGRQLRKNARALVVLAPGADLAILAIGILQIACTLALFPVSLIWLAVAQFSLVQYTLCYIMNRHVQKHIIAPYEASAEEGEAERQD